MKTVLKPSGENSFWVDAFRDLVIVVVGILAALWLESWWQDQLDRKQEQQILTGLRTEFSENRTELIRIIENWERVTSGLTDAHEMMGKPPTEETIEEFANVIRSSVQGGIFYDPRFGQLTSVINSGQLGLISNANLRALIAGWPALVTDLDLEKQMFAESFTHGFGATSRRYGSLWQDSALEPEYEQLLNNRQFDNEIGFLIAIFNIMRNEGQTILEATNSIISLIETELDDG
jgi:hypothetical protein